MKRARPKSDKSTRKRARANVVSIYWLPPEIWVHVISFLDQIKDRWRVSLVCKAWNELAWDAFDPSFDDHCAICVASYLGRAETVRRLLLDKRVDLDYACNVAMWHAVYRWFQKSKLCGFYARKFYRELGRPPVHEIRDKMRDNPPAYGDWVLTMASAACLCSPETFASHGYASENLDEKLKIVHLLLHDSYLNPVDQKF